MTVSVTEVLETIDAHIDAIRADHFGWARGELVPALERFHSCGDSSDFIKRVQAAYRVRQNVPGADAICAIRFIADKNRTPPNRSSLKNGPSDQVVNHSDVDRRRTRALAIAAQLKGPEEDSHVATNDVGRQARKGEK